MDRNTLNSLTAKIETRTRRGVGGKVFEYVPTNAVITRLNEVFDGNWSSEVINTIVDTEKVIVHVRLRVDNIQHDGFGGAKIMNGEEAGNSFKAAKSKAIKEAAKFLGIGLDSDSDSGDFNNSSNNYSNKSNVATTSIPNMIGNPPNNPFNNEGTTSAPSMVPPSFPPSLGTKITDGYGQAPRQELKQEGYQTSSTSSKTNALDPEAPGSINDIQINAINNALNIRDTSFAELVKEVYTELNIELPKSLKLEDVSKAVAAKLIQAANKKPLKA